MKDLILLGAPGSGKGSQSKKLMEKGYVQISTGDLLREEIASGSKLGQEINEIIGKGNLINDHLALSLIKSKFKAEQSFIYDGFPRTVEQAKMLEQEILKNRDYQAVFFDISDEKLFDRIVHRRSCPKCGSIYNLKFSPPKSENRCDSCFHEGLTHRKDDEASILKTRLEVYHKSTAPVVEFFEQRGRLLRLNADQSGSQLFEELLKVI